MISVIVWAEGRGESKEFPDDRRVTVGRLASADICLPSDYVSRSHAALYRDSGRLMLQALGTNPTWLNGLEVREETPVEVPEGASIEIDRFKIHVVKATRAPGQSLVAVWTRIGNWERKLFDETLTQIDFRDVGDLPDRMSQEGCDILIRTFQPAYATLREEIESDDDACHAIADLLFQRLTLAHLAARDQQPSGSDAPAPPPLELPLDQFVRDRDVQSIISSIVKDLEGRAGQESGDLGVQALSEALMEDSSQLARIVRQRLPREKLRDLVREEFFRRIANLSFGLGPLEDLLENPATTEIMIVGHDRIYVEIRGRLIQLTDAFPSRETTRRILERAVTRANRRIDISQPMVDLQLQQDGSRMNAVIDPVSRSGDTITIRKFRARPFSLQELMERGMFSNAVSRFLRAAVRAKRNIVISGGTGSGKTTLLGALVAHAGTEVTEGRVVRTHERVVLIEDTPEIRLPAEMHVASLQTRPPNVEGRGELTMRQLVRNALRMRPDRLVVGECRGAEAIDMLQAMNTGHPGSFTTVHANSTEEAIGRIETMVLHGVQLPASAIRRQIASSIHLIVHVGRIGVGGSAAGSTRGTQRRIVEIAEVARYDDRRDRIDVVPIFQLLRDSATAAYRFTGWVPTFMAELEGMGLFSVEDLLEV